MIADIQTAMEDFSKTFEDELTARNKAGVNKILFELNLLKEIQPKPKKKKAKRLPEKSEESLFGV